MRAIAIATSLLLLGAAPAVPSVGKLADEYVALSLRADPTLAELTGIRSPDESALPDRSPQALRAYERARDELFAALMRVDATHLPAADRPTYARLRDALEAERGGRVCRGELWNVSHIGGWPAVMVGVAGAQPVATAADRAAALARWRRFGGFVDQEIANLKAGLATGYSVPKPVATRALAQVAALAALSPEQSPFAAPANGSTDAVFKAAFLDVVRNEIAPALARYRDFLRTTYLPAARETLGVSALPNGDACYRALLREHTTLDRTPEQVYALGEKVVAEHTAEIEEIGAKLFGTRGFAAIVARVAAAPDNHFASADEYLAFSKAALARTLAQSATVFERLPRQPIEITPLESFQAAGGAPAHYEPQPDPTKPGRYAIPLDGWKSTTRGEAEIAVFHETVPGHHLQVATAREALPDSDLAKLVANDAYLEGWARYAEGLSEDLSLYSTPYARITRRVWPARGLVVDPGIHAKGWSRARAIAYLTSTGRFDAAQADALVDRIAALPGQLTAYDSGGLAFLELRRAEERRLGGRFDLRRFHQRVLEEGIVPLAELQRHVQLSMGHR